jgi:hypothetical protein
MSNALHWLDTHGKAREHAVEQAASLFVDGYLRRYGRIIPPELHRLSALSSAKVAYVDGLPGGARLVPVLDGFEILVDSDLKPQRARTAIAHELVHTLFYSKDERIPTRLVRATEAEEHFCFDVARRVLAPLPMVEFARIPTLRSDGDKFSALVKTFKLSRHVAARLLLQDYGLASGVAAVWTRSSGVWEMKRGNCFASPGLPRSERARLHGAARAWLNKEEPAGHLNLTGLLDTSGLTGFVLVTQEKIEASQPSA